MTIVLGPITNPRSTGLFTLYSSATSRSYSQLARGVSTLSKRYLGWRDRTRNPLSVTVMLFRKNCNILSRHQVFYIRGDKSSFGEWGKLPLLLIGQSSEVSFAEKTVCLFSFIKAQGLWRVIRLAEHILRICLDNRQSTYPKNRVCVWRATKQKPLVCLLSSAVTTISFYVGL